MNTNISCTHCDNTGVEPRETSEYPPEPCSVCKGALTQEALIDRLYDEVNYRRQENERLQRTLEVIGLELKAYKEHYHHLLDLQAEVLLTQPMAPIVISKCSLGSSAAEVAAKEKDKAKEA